MRGAGEFTLIELMISVGIVATLAAVAIPVIYELQLKARLAEVPVVAAGVMDATVAYHHATVNPFAWAVTEYAPKPEGAGLFAPMGAGPRPWRVTPGGMFEAVGFVPTGDVRGVYKLNPYGSVGCLNTEVPGAANGVPVGLWVLTDLDEDAAPKLHICCEVGAYEPSVGVMPHGVCGWTPDMDDVY